MSLLLLVARLLLVAVFLVAGIAKLADLAGSRQAMRAFGVPAVLADPFGLLLPLAELTVAVALVPTVSAWWGALTLLLLFVGGIGSNLARGRQPDPCDAPRLVLQPLCWLLVLIWHREVRPVSCERSERKWNLPNLTN